ncbi:hypothetical protein MANES_13G071600v8 [Manihot esculenta]|uniref:Uncharacterized protein n=1 Tax=Manihot esculenta TaxID=3983 RepID=A0A2C9UPP1_MANES|nr:hypothetical protein MANES_13G071600v8 [Manihot esculenta]
MVQCRRPSLILLLWIFFLFIFFIGYCHASRAANVFDPKAKSQQLKGHFLNFLPRHLPIPSSGPSRRHNGIGLQSWRSP